jgi:hypothetical protein
MRSYRNHSRPDGCRERHVPNINAIVRNVLQTDDCCVNGNLPKSQRRFRCEFVTVADAWDNAFVSSGDVTPGRTVTNVAVDGYNLGPRWETVTHQMSHSESNLSAQKRWTSLFHERPAALDKILALETRFH